MPRERSPLKPAVIHGLVALLPFAAGIFYAYAGSHTGARVALSWLLPYLAIIVAFIGGEQWGRMLTDPHATGLDKALAASPAIIAWAALLTGQPWRVLLLLLALGVVWVMDEHGARRGWQTLGFLRLRRILTLTVALSVIAISWRAVRG